ncbi:hypothetical protein CYMTET_26894 [Cymbomonas tetramitiformis]|uniref:Uncharacterized protein n=1 Tax=Cymbomonas tetramitiformis TaxID=36881 RepID=A0AAE0FQV2_9CHLO|nr:hypothetical protein CYMTET_26894 [Cymbomonas tetramitiformis]
MKPSLEAEEMANAIDGESTIPSPAALRKRKSRAKDPEQAKEARRRSMSAWRAMNPEQAKEARRRSMSASRAKKGGPQYQPGTIDHPDFDENAIETLVFGEMSCRCDHCGAKFWEQEKTVSESRKDHPVSTKCCNQHAVRLQPFPSAPQPLATYLHDRTFRQEIRKYNSMLAFASEKIDLDPLGAGPSHRGEFIY